MQTRTRARNRLVLLALFIIVVVASGVLAGLYLAVRPSGQGEQSTTTGSSGLVQVVAAENFWGSLASQIGGSKVNVTSVVSDPNTDPHEYESNPANAIAIARAQLVIVNGAGYDTWALDIISANNARNQLILNIQQLLNQPVDANPHFWYSPYYVNDTAAAIYGDLVKIDPSDAGYFQTQYAELNSSLWTSFMHQELEIKDRYAGAPVASTETVFVYMANATGLDIVSPTAFMNAVSEGNDPPAQSVAQFQTLLQGGTSSVRLLVYNEQTVTPLTKAVKAEASQYQIPTIGVTETIQPPNYTFQAWMEGEVGSLMSALSAQVQGSVT